ncbi:MAG: Isochorismate synthase MenF, partial [Bacilli bacterium]|nr:Isochorismate synthase MenF [Bacilli bacterium]
QGNSWLTVNQLVNAGDEPTRIAEQLLLLIKTLFELPLPDLYGASVYPVAAGSLQVVENEPEKWKEAVAHASREIRAGMLHKVVLARELQVSSELPLSPELVLTRLREEQPMSYLFAVESGAGCFLGATPERLVKRKNNTFSAACLAGSTGRGNTPAEDLRLGMQLLQDPKNRIEHQVVVDMIREAMGEVCDDVVTPEGPVLYKVRDLQHLVTPVTGQARAGVSILSVVQRLHPTPAVGGLPRAAALERIRQYEEFQRGWYGAPVGWLDYRGEGEFSVAIRSGLLCGTSALLFAGCGIVGDSDPDSEYEETRLKFKPILSALGVTAR